MSTDLYYDEWVLLRQAIRDVLATNSVLVSEDANIDQLIAALRQTFGVPPLAEAMLLALKRTGAREVYRDFSDEGVRIRFSAERLDAEPWVQSPQNGPQQIEMGPQMATTVTIPRREPPPVEPISEADHAEHGFSPFLEDSHDQPPAG